MSMRRTLEGRQIVIGVTGSIAAVEMVRIIHVLRRKGADVHVVMSPAACGIVSPDALAYASGRPVITRISGLVEHVTFCGDGGVADLLLIAPCTANTIGKIACGIDDTPVTTFATTALGSGKPVILVPAMHHSMYRHPAVIDNIGQLRRFGITVVDPVIGEGKAKLAGMDEVVLACERAVMRGPLSGKKVLITSGPCREPVDDVRVLTTRSSGQIGRELALEAFRLGADVTVVHRDRFPCVTNLFSDSAREMRDQVISSLKTTGADIYISAAAISDYAPVRQDGKIPSGKAGIAIPLEPLDKLLPEVLAMKVPVVVAFKLGYDTSAAADALLAQGVSRVIMNAPGTMGSPDGDYIIASQDRRIPVSGTKAECAAAILRSLSSSE